MRHLVRTTRRFLRDRRGATAIEYGIIATGIAGAIVLIVFTTGETVLNGYYQRIHDGLVGGAPSGGGESGTGG